MKVLIKEQITQDGNLIDTYLLNVVPRFFNEGIITTLIREGNSELVIENTPTLINGVIRVDLSNFLPVENCRYSITLKDASGQIIWTGQAIYFEGEKQNYHLNNSVDENLRF